MDTLGCNAGLPSADNHPPIKFAVLGAGAFGTAMAHVAARQQNTVSIYARDPSVVEGINTTHRNPKYLPSCHLPPQYVSATTNVEDCVKDAHVIMLCIPTQKTPDFLRDHRHLFSPNSILCCTSKGLYVPTRQLLSDAMKDALSQPTGTNGDSLPLRLPPIAFLSGPSFAAEIVKDAPTCVVVACETLPPAVKIQRALSTVSFRVYTSQDTIGVQLGGALKNPLAVGAGMVEGAGFGINTIAAYVTRSCNELRQLVVALGGKPETVAGLSGVGDLMLTAFGSLSRNRSLGIRLIKGETVEEICKEYTVEGVPTSEVAVMFADDCGLELPIFRAVAKIISGEVKPEDAQNLLMYRPLKTEN